MAMAIELITRYKIKDIVIIEKSGGFGGTWRDNIYPGAACDVFSSLYSYSFAQKFDFTRSLPGQEEILVRPMLLSLTDVADFGTGVSDRRGTRVQAVPDREV